MNITIPSSFSLAGFLNNKEIAPSTIIRHVDGNYVGFNRKICCIPEAYILRAGGVLKAFKGALGGQFSVIQEEAQESQQEISIAQGMIKQDLKDVLERTPAYRISSQELGEGPDEFRITRELEKFDQFCTNHPYLTKGELKNFFQEHNITVEPRKSSPSTSQHNEKTPLLSVQDKGSPQDGGRYKTGYGTES